MAVSVRGGGGARPDAVRRGGGANEAGSRSSLMGRATCVGVLEVSDLPRPVRPLCGALEGRG